MIDKAGNYFIYDRDALINKLAAWFIVCAMLLNCILPRIVLAQVDTAVFSSAVSANQSVAHQLFSIHKLSIFIVNKILAGNKDQKKQSGAPAKNNHHSVPVCPSNYIFHAFDKRMNGPRSCGIRTMGDGAGNRCLGTNAILMTGQIFFRCMSLYSESHGLRILPFVQIFAFLARGAICDDAAAINFIEFNGINNNPLVSHKNRGIIFALFNNGSPRRGS